MSFPDHMSCTFDGLQAPRKQEIILCRRNISIVGNVSDYARTASVVIAMPLHNQAETLRTALKSALAQKLSDGHSAVVLLDDQSTDNWRDDVKDLLLHPAVILLTANCGYAALARNAILDFVESELPNARWIARLDPDDELCSSLAVESLRSEGEKRNASFVLGSNYLINQGTPKYPANIANPEVLLNKVILVKFIEEFCMGSACNELPSCNLLIRAGQGIRYPLLRSAEDHWLVAQLLMFRSDQAAVVPYPVYCHYSLKGKVTTSNKRIGEHRKIRKYLSQASRDWLAAIADAGEILGYGMEGCVWKQDDNIIKRFYPSATTAEDISRLAECTRAARGRLPIFEWSEDKNGTISCKYDWTPLDPVAKTLPTHELQSYLLDLAHAGLVTCNIKRENLRLNAGRLIFIDIGKDIRPFDPSIFMDSAARLYAIGVLGLPDGELSRRQSYLKQHEALAELEGFETFYYDLVAQLYPLVNLSEDKPLEPSSADDVTLLIKACSQDHASLVDQVAHIVSQLSIPRKFAKVVLAIDPHVGKYLRQFTQGDLQALIDSAEHLRVAGIIDMVWVAPQDAVQIESVHKQWFGVSGVNTTHTISGAPVFSQLWAFEQVDTRYVLQADVDVLIGRKDKDHDYLSEMLAAIQHELTWCVGFNIPKCDPGFQPYTSRPDGYVPEVRLGLLDLSKIRSHLPLPNKVSHGRLLNMWHRSMEDAQRSSKIQSVRGGDDRSFYVHPPNDIKAETNLEIIRDLIGQGVYPLEQAEKWDLVFDAPWSYPHREESIVFLLKGRNTPKEKLRRCLKSLQSQTDQDFGVILIDDASDPMFSWHIDYHLESLRKRTTLVRRRIHKGYIPNFLLASELCSNPDTLIAVLDQDDVLMNTSVVKSLKRAKAEGADLINGLMFRPNKPTRFYLTDYERPREKGGGNTWSHLRAFTKSLFDSVPSDQYMVNEDWIADISDYATMLPMVELAKNPVQMTDQYYLWHERPEYSVERKGKQARLLQMLLTKSALTKHTV